MSSHTRFPHVSFCVLLPNSCCRCRPSVQLDTRRVLRNLTAFLHSADPAAAWIELHCVVKELAEDRGQTGRILNGHRYPPVSGPGGEPVDVAELSETLSSSDLRSALERNVQIAHRRGKRCRVRGRPAIRSKPALIMGERPLAACR